MRGALARFAVVLVAALGFPRAAAAEWQLKPFLGVTFGGSTTFVDLEHAAGTPNVAFGATVVRLGEVIGVEADFGHAPGFFQAGNVHSVLKSSATTFTGDVVVAVPRRLARYTLRPYALAGAGLMRVHIEDAGLALPISESLMGLDFGGGVTGFIKPDIGVSWEFRHFGSIGGDVVTGFSLGPEQISFWRASMALAIRY